MITSFESETIDEEIDDHELQPNNMQIRNHLFKLPSRVRTRSD
jgi:hypothetical protein